LACGFATGSRLDRGLPPGLRLLFLECVSFGLCRVTQVAIAIDEGERLADDPPDASGNRRTYQIGGSRDPHVIGRRKLRWAERPGPGERGEQIDHRSRQCAPVSMIAIGMERDGLARKRTQVAALNETSRSRVIGRSE
jgi:hypothetical protein